QEHRCGEHAGVSVLQRGMVARQQMHSILQYVFSAVGEFDSLPRREHSGANQITDEVVEADLTQADDDAQAFEQRDFLVEPVRAVALLLWSRLVGWRSAPNGSAYPHVGQSEPVVATRGVGLRGEAGFVQHWKHEVPRTVAGEGTAGT